MESKVDTRRFDAALARVGKIVFKDAPKRYAADVKRRLRDLKEGALPPPERKCS